MRDHFDKMTPGQRTQRTQWENGEHKIQILITTTHISSYKYLTKLKNKF